jgi:hypothetical protein
MTLRYMQQAAGVASFNDITHQPILTCCLNLHMCRHPACGRREEQKEMQRAAGVASFGDVTHQPNFTCCLDVLLSLHLCCTFVGLSPLEEMSGLLACARETNSHKLPELARVPSPGLSPQGGAEGDAAGRRRGLIR